MGALLAKIGQGVGNGFKGIGRALKKAFMATVSFATLRWLAGGRQGPPPMEEVAQDVEEPAPSDQAHDQAFEAESNPFARVRKGFEPQDVRNYLAATTSHERGELSGRLKTVTWQWAESLSEPQRKAVLASSNDAIRNHLTGREPIGGVPSVASAMQNKLRDPMRNPYAPDLASRILNDNGDRRVVQLHPDHQKAAQAVFGKRANDMLPVREAQGIEAGTAETIRDAEKTERRRRTAATTTPTPRPRKAAGFAFG